MSNVPMTRHKEMLVEHKTNYFHDSTFVELDGGKILHTSGGKFTSSEDGGMTWSAESQCKDKEGNPIKGGFPFFISYRTTS